MSARALATWTHDKTQSDKGEAPCSVSEISRHLAPAQAADEIGRLGDFRVLRVFGSGGFAVVFEAEDIRLKRHVALKLMHPVIAARHADRFLREAQSAAALRHEHVVTIYQVGMHGDTPFIALELLQGETLEDHLISESRLSVQETVRIGARSPRVWRRLTPGAFCIATSSRRTSGWRGPRNPCASQLRRRTSSFRNPPCEQSRPACWRSTAVEQGK